MKSYRGKAAFVFSNAKLNVITATEGSLTLYGKSGVPNPQIFRVSVIRDYDFFLNPIYI